MVTLWQINEDVNLNKAKAHKESGTACSRSALMFLQIWCIRRRELLCMCRSKGFLGFRQCSEP